MEMEEDNVCPVDGSNNAVCGGPHDEVFTDLGWEVGKLGFEPVGTRLTPTPADQANRYSVKRETLEG
jgi:hypothetical protein